MIINLSGEDINEKKLIRWLGQVMLELEKRNIQPKFMSKDLKRAVDRWDINLVFVLEQKIQELNRTFRNQDCVTDILSFSFIDKHNLQSSNIDARNRGAVTPFGGAVTPFGGAVIPLGGGAVTPSGGIVKLPSMEVPILGELVLCLPVIRQKAMDLDFSHWLYYLIVHGILHLFGFQHELSDREGEQMYRIQDEVFEKLVSSIED